MLKYIHFETYFGNNDIIPETQLRDSLNALGQSLEQCRGKGFDGAPNLIECSKGLATRVTNDFPLTTC